VIWPLRRFGSMEMSLAFSGRLSPVIAANRLLEVGFGMHSKRMID
jgi:hypothetical protein